MNIYVRNAENGLKFCIEVPISQKYPAPDAKGKRWRGFYLPLDSQRVINLSAQDLKLVVPPALQRIVIPVDKNQCFNSLKHQEV